MKAQDAARLIEQYVKGRLDKIHVEVTEWGGFPEQGDTRIRVEDNRSRGGIMLVDVFRLYEYAREGKLTLYGQEKLGLIIKLFEGIEQ